jgi:nitrogen regulatory protein P-II 1
MEFRKVTAIIRDRLLEGVEDRLKKMGVKGLSVTHVKGFGENKNISAESWHVTHALIEIYTERSKAEGIAAAIIEFAHTGGPGDGIVCILPVEKIFRIRTRSEAEPDEI